MTRLLAVALVVLPFLASWSQLMTSQLPLLVALAIAGTVSASMRFVVFLIGEKGHIAAKHMFADWWVQLEAGDWSKILFSTVENVERFFAHYLRTRFFSFRYFAFLVALQVAWLVFTAMISNTQHPIAGYYKYFWIISVPLTVANSFVDTFALGLTRNLFRRCSGGNSFRNSSLYFLVIMLTIPPSSASSAVLLVDACYAPFAPRPVPASAIVVVSLWGPLILLSLWTLCNRRFSALSLTALLFAWFSVFFFLVQLATGAGPQRNDVVLNLVPASLTSGFLLVIYIVCIILSFSEPVARKPVGIVVERLAEAPKGPLIALTDFIAGLIVVGGLWKDAIPQH